VEIGSDWQIAVHAFDDFIPQVTQRKRLQMNSESRGCVTLGADDSIKRAKQQSGLLSVKNKQNIFISHAKIFSRTNKRCKLIMMQDDFLMFLA
jgi:hypothetical protein